MGLAANINGEVVKSNLRSAGQQHQVTGKVTMAVGIGFDKMTMTQSKMSICHQ